MSDDCDPSNDSWRTYRYHFDMLNDVKRNDAYHSALARVVAADDVVVDIGAGSGLLVCDASIAHCFELMIRSNVIIFCEMLV